MHRSQRASPAIERCCGCAKIILKKPRVPVRAGEKPNVLVAVLPRGSRKKWRHRSARARSGQQAIEKIPARTEERNQTFSYGPGIIAGAAVERWWRNFSATTRSGKKNVHLAAVNFQSPSQVTRPRVLVRNTQRLPRTPLPRVHGVQRKLARLQPPQILIVLK